MLKVASNESYPDRRINIGLRYDRAYWAFVFGVSQQQLRDAVRKVGTMAADVERELGGRGRPYWKVTQRSVHNSPGARCMTPYSISLRQTYSAARSCHLR